MTGATRTILKASFAALAFVAYLYVVRFHFIPVFESREVGFTIGRKILTGFVALSILWLAGWYLILFSKPESGRVILHSNRSLHITLGMGMTMVSAMLAYLLAESQKAE